MPQEEDDLWCHLPAEELEEVNETVQRLVNKLTLTNEQVNALRHEGPQLVFVSTPPLSNFSFQKFEGHNLSLTLGKSPQVTCVYTVPTVIYHHHQNILEI